MDIQSELIFVNGMVHLPQEKKLWYTNNSPITSYTALTPHNSRSDFSSYETSRILRIKSLLRVLSALRASNTRIMRVVNNHWTGLVEWTTGMDYWNGLLD